MREDKKAVYSELIYKSQTIFTIWLLVGRAIWMELQDAR